MTNAESIITSATAELRESESKKGKQKGLLGELKEMSQAMIDQEGLLNHAQAALILEVSTRRVGELVETGKLKRFEFLGRTYVSVREVLHRRESDVKAGRPPRAGIQKLKTAAKLIANYDLTNLAMEMADSTPSKKRKKRTKKTGEK
jgi:hypothetical protein